MNENMAAGRDVKDSNIKVTLENKELWNKFGSIGTEMIITKCGRYMNTIIRDVILVFSRGGQNFDRLPRRGQNMKKTKCCGKKHKKSLFFKIRGGQMPPLPPQNDVPDYNSRSSFMFIINNCKTIS